MSLRHTPITILLLALLCGCQPKPAPPQNGGGNTGDADQAASQDGAQANEYLTPEIIAEHNRGVGLMGQFQYEKAHDVFAPLAEKFSGWHDVQVDLAIAKLNRRQENDVAGAESLLDKVIAADPEHLRAKYCRGILLKYAGDNDSALKMFREVASADRSDAYAIYYTGQCLFDAKDFESALTRFKAAQALDPYLRSSYYGAFQAFQRTGNMEKAKEQLEIFQKLATNPQARNAEIKYSRMGPKAETLAVRMPGGSDAKPTGELFADAVAIVEGDWKSGNDCTFTCCDINGDGSIDLFAAGEQTTVLLATENGFRNAGDHPLNGIADVNAALWGDIDNDGLVDVYLCCKQANQLWRQVETNKWQNVTEESKTSGAADANTVDGAIFDADHDGDLDVFLVNSNAKNELLNNNLDGTFRPLAEQQELTGEESSRGIVVADLDNDRDVD
ncbi:MAG: FG-GAP-like repeat-containing protein, partial [Planctomycetota bacterium]